MPAQTVGFLPDEILTDRPTRDARLKWVIVVDSDLAPGRQVNAAVCAAAATQDRVQGLLGPDGVDADGVQHVGLPWAGCTVLGATGERLDTVLRKARTRDEVFVAVVPLAAQETRVYDEYLSTLASLSEGELRPIAISLVGPRKDVDKIIGGLSLLP